jgi:hypothetical protein
MSYELLEISHDGERGIRNYADQAQAFEACIKRWEWRRPASPVFAVLDVETGQRWSYRDIVELR